jgi:hypothetical protein
LDEGGGVRSSFLALSALRASSCLTDSSASDQKAKEGWR